MIGHHFEFSRFENMTLSKWSMPESLYYSLRWWWLGECMKWKVSGGDEGGTQECVDWNGRIRNSIRSGGNCCGEPRHQVWVKAMRLPSRIIDHHRGQPNDKDTRHLVKILKNRVSETAFQSTSYISTVEIYSTRLRLCSQFVFDTEFEHKCGFLQIRVFHKRGEPAWGASLGVYDGKWRNTDLFISAREAKELPKDCRVLMNVPSPACALSLINSHQLWTSSNFEENQWHFLFPKFSTSFDWEQRESKFTTLEIITRKRAQYTNCFNIFRMVADVQYEFCITIEGIWILKIVICIKINDKF